jgi:hypothetical protein
MLELFGNRSFRATSAKNIAIPPHGNPGWISGGSPTKNRPLGLFQNFSFWNKLPSLQYEKLRSISQSPVGLEKRFRKSGPRPAFSYKSRVAFPKTGVLEKPLG